MNPDGWAGWAVFGVIATSLLTGVLIMAQLAGLTRLDLPLMLGTLFVADPDRARVVGFFAHLAFGRVFAFTRRPLPYSTWPVRASLAEDGTWMIVEPRAGDGLADNLNPVGRIFYSASTMICVPGFPQPGGGPRP